MSALEYSEATCRFRASGRNRKRPAALDRFSLRCPPEEITCLLGPNGAGKSTALAAAAGLIPLQEGSIAYAGRPVGLGAPAREMGYLPQTSSFPAVLTVGEILAFSFAVKGSSPAERDRTIDLFGLGDKIGEAAGTLSSGWTRRLGLAVALLPGSTLLLLDEPFVGLDLAVLDAVVEELLVRAEAGATVVLSSHDFEIVDLLRPRIAVLSEGRVLEEGGAGASGKARGEGSRALYRRALETSNPGNERETLTYAARG